MRYLAVVCTILWLAFPPTLLAHGGGLDSLGCHHDRKRGGYHCHRGPLAGRSFASKEEAEKTLYEQQKPEQKAPPAKPTQPS